MNTFLDCVMKSQSLVDNLSPNKTEDEEKDIEDMDLDEKIDFHFKQDSDKVVINNEINRILRINQNISSIINNNILMYLVFRQNNSNSKI